ncbi:hypothetical protein SAMN05216302_102433 [Nitrosomonas aestuarii]|uniref:Uncharacterized protein n=1 Tax=Nitrosomonas aestuarii TaxID=52441 RepID=A0A1I4E1H0_9PROT|nr:hypothetical protein SAMN05216302_102433 [Nitrosomonas aestuarii]
MKTATYIVAGFRIMVNDRPLGEMYRILTPIHVCVPSGFIISIHVYLDMLAEVDARLILIFLVEQCRQSKY